MNPGFESGVTSWDRVFGTGVIASPGRTGNNRLDEPTQYPWWQQDINPFKPGATYRVSGWGKCDAAGGELGLKGGKAVGDERMSTGIFTSSWAQQSFDITLSNDVTYVQLFLTGFGTNCSYDDISVVEL